MNRASIVVCASLLQVGCSSGADSSSDGSGVNSGGVVGSGGSFASSGGVGGSVVGSGGTTGSGGNVPGGAGRGGSPNPGGGAGASGAASSGGAGGPGGATGSGGTAGSGGASGGPVNPIRYVFVVTMENHDGTSIYGNNNSAPYINGTLIPTYASASAFTDPLPLSILSEPHYIWMEAGTNVFSDHTFSTDDDPSASNSTSSTDHLVTQMDAKGGLSWLSYQEGLDGTTGACPVNPSGFYAPKHDPFVFFHDVAGSPPSATNAKCADHHKPLSALSADLAGNGVARYNFITPNLCNDMHGQFGCPSIDLIKPGDDWLKANLPALITFCNANDGVVFIVWDEGEGSQTIPFLAVGPSVKTKYSSGVTYTHGSLVKSVEEFFGLPILATVAGDNDFADLFLPGAFP